MTVGPTSPASATVITQTVWHWGQGCVQLLCNPAGHCLGCTESHIKDSCYDPWSCQAPAKTQGIYASHSLSETCKRAKSGWVFKGQMACCWPAWHNLNQDFSKKQVCLYFSIISLAEMAEPSAWIPWTLQQKIARSFPTQTEKNSENLDLITEKWQAALEQALLLAIFVIIPIL